MNKLPALIGALAGGTAALACVALITDAVTPREIAGGAAVLAVTIFALILIAKD